MLSTVKNLQENERESGHRYKRITYMKSGTNGKDSENNNPNMGMDRLYKNNQDYVSCQEFELDRSKYKFVVIVLNAEVI
jgi:hypothetical protein